MNVKKPFVINVNLFLELHKYKPYFADALRIYRNRALDHLTCDYESNNTKKTAQLKITIDPDYWESVYEEIVNISKSNVKGEEALNKINTTVLLNNIMSTLIGIEQYN